MHGRLGRHLPSPREPELAERALDARITELEHRQERRGRADLADDQTPASPSSSTARKGVAALTSPTILRSSVMTGVPPLSEMYVAHARTPVRPPSVAGASASSHCRTYGPRPESGLMRTVST